jgi:hypothetical protein
LLQHDTPHGVSPLQQQVTVAGSEHVSRLGQHPSPQNVMMLGSQPQRPIVGSAQMRPAGQQLSPHGVNPGSQLTVSTPWARNGLSTVAAVAPTIAPPSILRMPRRGIDPDAAREISSNRSLMAVLPPPSSLPSY